MSIIKIYPVPAPAPPPVESFPYTVRLNVVEAEVCATATTTVYSASATWAVGMVLYSDAALTSMVLVFNFVSFNDLIYELNIEPGEVGAATGNAC